MRARRQPTAEWRLPKRYQEALAWSHYRRPISEFDTYDQLQGPREENAGRFTERTVRNICVIAREIHAVEDVEEFGAELCPRAFFADEPRNPEVLHRAEIDVRISRSAERVPPETSFAARRWRRKVGGCETACQELRA